MSLPEATAMTPVSVTIRAADIIPHLKNETLRMCYLCYNMAFMMQAELEATPEYKTFQKDMLRGSTVPSRHYAFLESQGMDYEMSRQVVGQVNAYVKILHPEFKHYNDVILTDELLNLFQSRPMESIQSQEYVYTVWGRECRINLLECIVLLNPDAVFEINLE
jgi:hypothetical protein